MAKINIVDSNGNVVSVDESAYDSAIAVGNDPRLESGESGVESAHKEAAHERFGGVVGGVASAAAGGLDALSFGGFGKLAGAVGLGEDYADLANEHPDARTTGEIGSFLVPGLGELGAGGQVGRVAKALGAGKGIARAAEGFAYGVGGHIAQSNVDGSDPFTAEALTAGGIGALLNYGIGSIGDRLKAGGTAAQAAITADAAGDTASQLFEEPHPAYDTLRTAADSDVEAAAKTNRDVASRQAKLDRYADSTEDYANDIKKYENVVKNDLVADINAARKRATVIDVPAATSEDTSFDPVTGQPSKPPTPARRIVEPGPPPNKWERSVTLKEATDVADDALKTIKRASDLRYEGPDGIKKGVELLRPLREGLADRFHYAVPDLPEIPGRLVHPLDALDGLPKDLEGFARMSPEKAAAFSAQMTPNVQTALRGLANELKVLPDTAGAAGTFDGIRNQLAGHIAALDAIEAGATKASNSLLVKTIKWITRRGVRMAAGGIAGAAIPIPGAALAGAAVGGFSHTMAAAALESGARVRSAIRGVVAKYGGRVGGGVGRMAPVTSYLMNSFPSGKKDKSSTDIGQLAKNRLRELAGATVTAPDTLYHAVAPLHSVPGGIGAAVHLHVNAALQHTLKSVARDPGTAPHGGRSDWKPSPTEAVSMAYRLEALQNPLDAMARALSGDVHPDGIDALHANWPALSGVLANEMAGRDTDDLSPERLRGYSALLGTPQSGLSVPANVIALQGMYLPGASQARQPQSQQSEQPGEPGRPPKAGRSTVAGSNVNSLITQG